MKRFLCNALFTAHHPGETGDDCSQASLLGGSGNIQIKTIESWIAKAEGDHARALQLARAAAKHEDSTEKHVVTPEPILPARELLGTC